MKLSVNGNAKMGVYLCVSPVMDLQPSRLYPTSWPMTAGIGSTPMPPVSVNWISASFFFSEHHLLIYEQHTHTHTKWFCWRHLKKNFFNYLKKNPKQTIYLEPCIFKEILITTNTWPHLIFSILLFVVNLTYTLKI